MTSYMDSSMSSKVELKIVRGSKSSSKGQPIRTVHHMQLGL